MKNLTLLVLMVILSAVILAGCTSSSATTTATSSAPPSAAPSSIVPSSTAPTAPLATTSTVPPTVKPTQASPTASATTTPQKYGGTLTILTNTLPPQIGYPAEITASTNIFSSYTTAMYDRLFGRDLSYRPTPGLVRSWDIAADKKSMIWHLAQGVKFQDGTDFDANAVKYNLEAQAATPTGKGLLSNITSFEVIDSNTLKINMSSFSAVLMPGTLAGYVGYIASPTAMKKTGSANVTGPAHMVGTGPFKFVDYQRDVLLKFDKWTGYYEKGKPYLDGVLIEACADYTTKIAAFKAGVGQYVSDLRGQDVPALRADGYVINQYDSCAAFGLFPDSLNKDSPWSDIRVRQAAQYAIDTQAIGSKVFGEGTLGTTQAAAPNDPFYVPGLERPYNPAKAKELLASAGYPNGFKTTFYVDMSMQNAQNYSSAVQAYMKAVGIDMAVELCDMPRLSALKTQGWKNGVVDGGTMITGLAGFQAMFSEYPRSTQYRSTARPAGLQAQIDAICAESNDATRLEMYKGLTKTLFDDCTYPVIYAQYLISAYSPELHDTLYGKGFTSYWEPQNAWLSAKK